MLAYGQVRGCDAFLPPQGAVAAQDEAVRQDLSRDNFHGVQGRAIDFNHLGLFRRVVEAVLDARVVAEDELLVVAEAGVAPRPQQEADVRRVDRLGTRCLLH